MRSANLCTPHQSNTTHMFYLLVDFVVYKRKVELSLDYKILGFVQYPHPLLLNNLLIRCINFSPTNGRFLIKWTMELVYKRSIKKLWLCNWFFLIECRKNRAWSTWFSNILSDNSFKQIFYVVEVLLVLMS